VLFRRSCKLIQTLSFWSFIGIVPKLICNGHGKVLPLILERNAWIVSKYFVEIGCTLIYVDRIRDIGLDRPILVMNTNTQRKRGLLNLLDEEKLLASPKSWMCD